jgi:hypothetical protein
MFAIGEIMKLNLLASILLFCQLGSGCKNRQKTNGLASILGSNVFICAGERSRFSMVEGYYAGEYSDAVSLKTSEVYGIYDIEEYNENLLLPRMRENPLKDEKFEEFSIQFGKIQHDEGTLQTTFAMPPGVFGGPEGKAFAAFLVVDGEESKLECELVDPYRRRS